MSKRVLAVDDSPMVLDILAYTVSDAGYVVDTARNGAEALERLSEHRFHLALVDLNMPVMDGLTLCRHLRRDPRWQDLMVIIVTTESEVSDREQGLAVGANLYMIKPVDERRLIANIRLLIGDPEA